VTRANKTGLVLAGLLGLLDVINLFSINTPFPEGMTTTPPDWLFVLVAILGLVTLAAIVPAWRGNHRAVLVVVATRILSAISAVPAYFVNVPSYILITTTVIVVVTILAVWLILRKTPTKREI
jgi:drug/metabolite transporter (DMT)-like permease